MSTISPDLPLIDLHRHLEGNVRPETVFDLRRQHGLPLPVDSLAEFRTYVQVNEPQPGLLAFFEKFDWVTGALVDYEACDRIAYESVADARREGLDYFEDKLSTDRYANYHLLCVHDRRRMVWAGSTAKYNHVDYAAWEPIIESTLAGCLSVSPSAHYVMAHNSI